MKTKGSIRLSLQFKVIITVILTLLLLALSLVYFYGRQMQHTADVALNQRAEAIANGLANECEYGLLVGSKALVQQAVVKVLAQQDVVSAVVFDEDGRIMAAAGAVDVVAKKNLGRAFVSRYNDSRVVEVSQERPDLRSFYLPVYLRPTSSDPAEAADEALAEGHGLVGRKLGLVEVTLNLLPTRVAVQRARLTALVITAILALVLSVLGTLQVRRMVRPLHALVAGTEHLAAGDLHVRVEPASADEIGELAHAFNEMAQALTVKDTQVRHYAAELEQRVAERTAALAQANEALEEEIRVRKQAEQTLTESERRFRDLFENSPDAIFVEDTNGDVLDVNRAACRLHGLGREQLVGKNVLELVPAEERERVWRDFQRQMAGQQEQVESYSFGCDGRAVPVELRTRRIEYAGKAALLVHARDITERKRAEEALRVRERQQAAVARLGQRALVHTDIQALMDETVALVAATLEVEYCKVLELLPGGERLLLRAGVGWREGLVGRATVDTGNDSQAGHTLQSKEPVLVEDLASERRFSGPPLLREHGVVSGMSVIIGDGQKPFGVLGAHTRSRRVFTVDDIHFMQTVANVLAEAIERKRAEQALREAEAKYRTLVEQLPAIVYIAEFGEHGRWHYVSPQIESVLGFTPLEWMTDTGLWLKQMFPEDRQRVLAAEARCQETGEPFDAEYRIRARDGRVLWFRDGAVVVKDDAGQPVFLHGVMRDVTESKQLQEQLLQSQKMQSVGRLAGGVAHDFNNILTAITGYCELSLRRVVREDPLHRNIEQILKAAERAANLTRQLLAFSRKQTLQPKVFDLNTVVADMDKMLRRLIGEDIELHTLLARGIGRVKADPGQIEQVIMNLAVNARDAMPRGGCLTIETADITLDANYARQRSEVVPGPYVMIAVTDTGTGMTEEVRAHLFEPFFTTKSQGQGTGLGLATCYGIIKQSGGHISVYTEAGKGTTFKVYLPRVEADLDAPAKADEASRPPVGGTESVLLVEDEPVLRELASFVLRELGYPVVEAANGLEALRLVDSQGDRRFDLVVTDVIMPQMGGKELADQLRARNHNAKVLFMSGYTEDAIVNHGVLEPGIAFLQKPFTPAELARKVRETLDRSPAATAVAAAEQGQGNPCLLRN